jgi:ribonuclease BN (tRNA processing enzyme)
MEVTFLGTGTGAPSARRGSPGLIVKETGITLLFDSGTGTLRQIERAGLSYNDLDNIFYTHLHPDHVAELVPYLFAARYFAGFTRTDPVNILGPEGLLKFHELQHEAFGHWIEPAEGMIILSEIFPNDSFQCGPLKVEVRPITHLTQSLGYRISDPNGTTLAISGDTDFSPELIELARDVDLLITECSFPEGVKIEGHLVPSQAGIAAREAGAKALALTHFYPECDGHDLLGPVTQEYGGPVTLAEDLLSITV